MDLAVEQIQTPSPAPEVQGGEEVLPPGATRLPFKLAAQRAAIVNAREDVPLPENVIRHILFLDELP